MEPIGYLIAKRKSLKLTEALLAQLKTLAGTAQTRDEPLLRVVDSLKAEMRPSGPVNDELRLRMRATRQELMRVVGALRINYLASAIAALPMLDEGQSAPVLLVGGRRSERTLRRPAPSQRMACRLRRSTNRTSSAACEEQGV